MDLMDIQDISYVDFDELGVRPFDWHDDSNDLDDTSNGFFDKNKKSESQLLSDEKKLATDEVDALMPDEDESNYQIDPETGEKIFCEVSAASSPSSASTNDKWIEEYLSHIESSTTSDTQLPFEDISFNHERTDSSWFPNYLPFQDLTNKMMMFPNQILPDQFVDDNNKNLPSTTSSIFIPLSNRRNTDSLTNLLGVSVDDEYSVGRNSNNNRRQRLFSSFESDSTTCDSELTFDGSYFETKLEKTDHDEHSIPPPMFLRRSSTRTNSQGQQDEETLRRYNIPLNLYDITQSSTEEYNRHLAHLNHLTPEQIHIIKDIRRRGKNKIAAQNCRKRKASGVETLLDEVDELKRVKHDLEQRKKAYQQQIIETRNQYEYLHRQVLPDRQLLPAINVK